MPELFGRKQQKFGECTPWDTWRAPAPTNIWELPNYEKPSTEDVKAVPLMEPGERERYGHGTPLLPGASTDRLGFPIKSMRDVVQTFDTAIGPISLTKSAPKPAGWLPTAASLDFLKHEYQASCSIPRTRYF